MLPEEPLQTAGRIIVYTNEPVDKKMGKSVTVGGVKFVTAHEVINTNIRRNKQNHSLEDYAAMILGKVYIINWKDSLYYYTGKTYRLIENSEELIRVIRRYIDRSAFSCTSLKVFTDVITFLKTDEKLLPDKYMDKEADYYISFQNGVLNLRNMELLGHSPEYLTFYELDAWWGVEKRARYFKEYLDRVSGGDDSIKTRIMESVGYLLSPTNRGKYFFVMGTAPNSGKSTLGKLLQILIGDRYIAHISPNQLGERFALGNIQGKLLNSSMDLPKGKLNQNVVSIIKQITGGDEITTEQKYERMKSEKSSMRFLFASNFPVAVPKADGDDAFWNRMVILPFQNTIRKEDEDYGLLDAMMEEKDAIIYICLKIFQKLQQRGYVFSDCMAAEEMKKDWQGLGDGKDRCMSEFLDGHVDVTGNEDDRVLLDVLYERYQEFSNENGYEALNYPLFKRWCDSNIKGCEHIRFRGKGDKNAKSGYKGIRLKEEEEIQK